MRRGLVTTTRPLVHPGRRRRRACGQIPDHCLLSIKSSQRRNVHLHKGIDHQRRSAKALFCRENYPEIAPSVGLGIPFVAAALGLSLAISAASRRKEENCSEATENPISLFEYAKPQELWTDISLLYDLGSTLGTGGFGEVRAGREKATGSVAAIKAVRRTPYTKRPLQNEMEALLRLRELGGHENIVSIHAVIQNPNTIFLVTEFVGGGELFDHLVRNGAYSEKTASRTLRQIGQALEFMHKHNIVHKDIKPENLMLAECSEEPQKHVIKVVDFGSAGPPELGLLDFADQIGTVAYMAPEVILGQRFGKEADMWAVGCILYIMLSGEHPFDPSGFATDEDVARAALRKKVSFDAPQWGQVSASAKNLIQGLLEKNPAKRLTASQMLAHPWVRSLTASDKPMEHSHLNLKQYTQMKKKLKLGLIGSMIADSLNTKQLQKHGESNAQKLVGPNTLRIFGQRGEEGFISLPEMKKVLREAGDEVSIDELRQIMSYGKSEEEARSFRGLGYKDYLDLMAGLSHISLTENDVVFQQGDPPDCFYFIMDGAVEVLVKGLNKPLAILQAGDFFGEAALLDGHVRNATVRCKGPTKLLAVSYEDFLALTTSIRRSEENLRAETIRRNLERAKEVIKIAAAVETNSSK